MSDQPKPTGDTTAFTHDATPKDFEPDQPKPAGEWTVKPMGLYQGDTFIHGIRDGLDLQRFADAHNASLAAEQRRANDSIVENVRLMNALAAERETSEAHWQKWQDESKSHRNDIDYLNQQLAAEQKKVQMLADAQRNESLTPRSQRW